MGGRGRTCGRAELPQVARPEDHGEERGRERLPRPSPDRPRRARAAGAGSARCDPGRMARGPQARQHRPRRGHIVVDGERQGGWTPPSKGCSRSYASSRRMTGSRSSPPATRSRRMSGSGRRARAGRPSPAPSAVSSRTATRRSIRPSPVRSRRARTRRSGPDQCSRRALRRRRQQASGTRNSCAKSLLNPSPRAQAFASSRSRTAQRRRPTHSSRSRRIGRRVLHGRPEGHQGRLPEDLVLFLTQPSGRSATTGSSASSGEAGWQSSTSPIRSNSAGRWR